MRAKPISVKFPVPKIAAAKLRDLAISRDPRLLELGILAVQITEHEKIVVSFGKPPCGQVLKSKAKPKNNREALQKTRVKTVRNCPKNATPVSRPATSHSISIPGIAAPLQNRNPVCHLHNNKVITNNTKGGQQVAKEKLRQAVHRRQDKPNTLTTQQAKGANITATNSHSVFVSIDRTTARNTSLSCSNIKVLSNSPPKRATEHRRLDNSTHGLLEHNRESSRLRAESEAVVRTATHRSPSASPSNDSTLSSSSSPPLGEAQNRVRSSLASSPEQASFSLMGLQETTYMGRQRALFDWVMNSEEKKFCASNRLRELAKVHGADVTSATTSPGISAPRQTTTTSKPSNTSASTQHGIFVPSTTNTTPITSPAACASTSTRTIPAPTPGIHRVKIPNRYSHNVTQAVQVSKDPLSVGGGLSESQTYFTTAQQESLNLPNHKESENKIASGLPDGSNVEVSNLMSSHSGQLFATTSSSSEQFWVPANQVNHGVASNSVINAVPCASEVKKTKTEPCDNGFVNMKNQKSVCKESHDMVACWSGAMLSESEVSSDITCQTDALSAINKNLQVMKPARNKENKEPLKYCVEPSSGHVNTENTQYLAMPTVDANNNQMDMSKPLNTPLMYPYSTGMLSTPVALGSEIITSPGVAIGLQHVMKHQPTIMQQACAPDKFAFVPQTAQKLESAPDVQTTSYATRTVASEIASSTLFAVQPQFTCNYSPVPTASQPVATQPMSIYLAAGPCVATDVSQAVTSPQGVINAPISAGSHCVTRAQVTMQSSASSQIATPVALVSTLNPQNALSFQALTNSQAYASPQVIGHLQNSANGQVTMSATSNTTQVSNKMEAVTGANFTPSPQMLINCQAFSPSQSVSSSQTTANPIVAQNSKLLLAARENLKLQSGQQLDSTMQAIKTEDYTESSQVAGKVLSDETNKNHENLALTAAPIQFIDLSGTLRYWQQWSLYYRNMIERQNAVAALLSMQNAVPPTTAITMSEDVQPGPEAGTEAPSSLSYSIDKEDQPTLQKLSSGALENQSLPNTQQNEKSVESLAGSISTAAKTQQSSEVKENASVGTLRDKTDQLASNSDCAFEKEFANTEIKNTPQSSAEAICNNTDLSAEGTTVISSRRRSVIVDSSRTNKLDFPISDRSDLKDSRCLEPQQSAVQSDNSMSENSIAEPKTSAVALGSPGNKPEDETMKNLPELENGKESSTPLQQTEIIVKTECVQDVGVCDRETPSPSTHDSSDDSSGSVRVTRRLRSSRSNSNPPTPELSFIPESSIECVNVGGNKRGI